MIRDISTVIFYLPIFSILLSINVFWIFLFYGFSKLDNKSYYFLVMGNILFYSTLSVTVYCKNVINFDFISYTVISYITIALQVINFSLIIIGDFDKSGKKKFDSKPLDMISTIINILLNIFFFSFSYCLGKCLDNKKLPEQENIMFFSVIIFFILASFKSFYKIGRIVSYFDWKKSVIL